jgi:hypothetical protein
VLPLLLVLPLPLPLLLLVLPVEPLPLLVLLPELDPAPLLEALPLLDPLPLPLAPLLPASPPLLPPPLLHAAIVAPSTMPDPTTKRVKAEKPKFARFMASRSLFRGEPQHIGRPKARRNEFAFFLTHTRYGHTERARRHPFG